MRATLNDPDLQLRLECDGFVVFPMLGTDEVERLRSHLDELGSPTDDPHKACHSSFHSADRDYKLAVDAAVKDVLGPHLESKFDRQRALPSNFIVKWPGGMGGFGLHQDLALVDEREHRSVEVWVALDDTNAANGQLWMVPGSHQWLPGNIRGIHAFPFAYSQVARRIIDNHAVPVPMRAGEAVVFNHAVLHFSMPNRTDAPRRVAIADLIPEEATHLHYFGDGEGGVEVYSIDDSFWTDNSPFTLWRPPARSRSLGAVRAPAAAMDDAHLDRLVAEGTAIESTSNPRGAINAGKPWCHRCGSQELEADSPDRWVGNVTLLCADCRESEQFHAETAGHVGPACTEHLEAHSGDNDGAVEGRTAVVGGARPANPEAPGSAHRDDGPIPVSPIGVLVDTLADEQLRCDGFVKLPSVVDPGTAAQLRSAYGRVHGWVGQGFEPDLLNADSDYRRLASEAIQAGLDEAVVPLFDGYVPFLRNFLCKWPGPDSDLYLHRDWMYVDERKGHRSYVAWVALQDISGHNGQLQVLRGSHRVDQMLRGTDLEAGWMEHEDVIRERLETVPVAAGDVIVFDNALVHCSFPNNTAAPRLVAAVGMRPAASSLVYWRRFDSETALRWDVDEGFFLKETPPGLIAHPPTTAPAETAPSGEVELTSAELATRLDDLARPPGPLYRARRWASRNARRTGRHQRPRVTSGTISGFAHIQPELRDRGFAAIEYEAADFVPALRGEFDSLGLTEDHGFYASCNDAPRDVARRVDLRIREILDPLLRSRFDGFEPFLTAFVSKGRQMGEMEFHQDLTYIDETEARSLLVWIPLVDTDEASGALEFVAGSHRWSEGLRPGGVGRLATAGLQEELRLASSPLAASAGSMVVFDHATAHGSAPNSMAAPRPAVALALRPAGAELLHYHIDSDGQLRGFAIDDRFFTTQEFRSRPSGYREVPVVGDVVTEVELRKGLERLTGGSTQRPLAWASAAAAP